MLSVLPVLQGNDNAEKLQQDFITMICKFDRMEHTDCNYWYVLSPEYISMFYF